MSNRRLTAICVALAAATACTTDTSEPAETRSVQAALRTAPTPTQRPPIRTDDPVPVGPHDDKIDWSSTEGFKRVDWTPIAAEFREVLQDVTLPVLAFDDPALLAASQTSARSNWYVITAKTGDGVNLMLRGTRQARVVPGMQINDAALRAAENYTFTRTHTVITVSWRAFGASYSLDVECANPLTDKRCTEDAYALSLVEGLGVAGGTP